MIRFRINDEIVHAEDGMTVLQAARRQGIHIPTLCHHDALSDIGACRVCVVEIEHPAGRSTVTASCTLPVAEGMSVQTHSDRALRTRRMMVEWLLARAPKSEVMRALAAEVGIEKSRFEVPNTGNCLLCGRCVRACSQHAGVATTAFAGRGRDRRVATPFDRESDVCLGCGSCVQVCPTGALTLEQDETQRRVILRGQTVRRVELVRCSRCGTAHTTVPWLRWVRERAGANEHAARGETCPRCSRLLGALRESPFAKAEGPDGEESKEMTG